MRFTALFKRQDETILELSFRSEHDTEPVVLTGDDGWFDYSQTIKGPFGEITINDNAWEWLLAMSSQIEQEDRSGTISLTPEGSEQPEPFGPPLPRQFEFQHEIMKHPLPELGLEASRWNGFALSGWWRRAAAYVLDELLAFSVYLITFAVIWLITGMTFTTFENHMDAVSSDGVLPGEVVVLLLVPMIVSFVFACAYYILTMKREGVRNGQSWGKQLMDITVIREDGKLAKPGFIFWRMVVLRGIIVGFLMIPLYGIFAWLNFLWASWDKNHQAVHDKAGKSYVVRTDAR